MSQYTNNIHIVSCQCIYIYSYHTAFYRVSYMVCRASHNIINQMCNNDIVYICIISTMSRLAQAESGRRYIHEYNSVYKSSFSIHLRHRYILINIMITVCVCLHVTYNIWYIIVCSYTNVHLIYASLLYQGPGMKPRTGSTKKQFAETLGNLHMWV